MAFDLVVVILSHPVCKETDIGWGHTTVGQTVWCFFNLIILTFGTTSYLQVFHIGWISFFENFGDTVEFVNSNYYLDCFDTRYCGMFDGTMVTHWNRVLPPICCLSFDIWNPLCFVFHRYRSSCKEGQSPNLLAVPAAYLFNTGMTMTSSGHVEGITLIMVDSFILAEILRNQSPNTPHWIGFKDMPYLYQDLRNF